MVSVPVVLDTSVVLNLLATGISHTILETLESQFFVCSAVVSEVLFLRGADPALPREVVSINPWLSSGIVSVASPENPVEEELYVQFAADLDDGEAMSLAICSSRNYAFATDDRKARRVASASTQLLSTTEIVERWASRSNAPPLLLSGVLCAIELKARFIPGSGDPLRLWWLGNRTNV